MTLNWTNNGEYMSCAYMSNKINKTSHKIAGFDFDDTIATSKAKSLSKLSRARPKDEDDWAFVNPKLKEYLAELIDQEYRVVFISNQKGLKTPEKIKSWQNKLDSILSQLDLPIEVFCSIGDNIYRKPNTGLVNIIDKDYDKDNSFYCGDAAGRIKVGAQFKDFADTDYKFAVNWGIKFLTPEQFYYPKEHEQIDNRQLNLNYPFDPKTHKNNNNSKTKYVFKPFVPKDNIKNELIVLIGFPGSGKSSFYANYLEPHGYVRLNQDELVTKTKVQKKYLELLCSSVNVVIDCTNATKDKRKYYVDLAVKHNYHIRCIHINTDFDTSLHNNYYRFIKNKQNLVPIIVYRMYNKDFQPPTKDERLNVIETVDFYEIIDIDKLDDDYFAYFY